MKWLGHRDLLTEIGKRLNNKEMGYNGDFLGNGLMSIRGPWKEGCMDEFCLLYVQDKHAYLYVENSGISLPGEKVIVNITDAFADIFSEDPEVLKVAKMSAREKEKLIFINGDYCLFAGWGDTSKLRF